MITEYQQRCLAQLQKWVDGLSEHNDIDNECCPDFSCCEPKLFIRDVAKRREMLADYMQRIGRVN